MSTKIIVETISTSFGHAVDAQPSDIEKLARAYMAKDFPSYQKAEFEIKLLRYSQTHKGFSEYIFQISK